MRRRLKSAVKTCMFDQYGTVVDVQSGLAEVAAPYLAAKGWAGDSNAFVTWWRRTHFENSLIDAALLRSAEARRLDADGERLRATFDRPGALTARGKSSVIAGPVGLVEGVMELGRRGIDVTRYKGLGEMNPEQLWETTLDPEARSLLQVKISHADLAEETFSTLMGDLVEPRRDFIQANALSVANLDV